MADGNENWLNDCIFTPNDINDLSEGFIYTSDIDDEINFIKELERKGVKLSPKIKDDYLNSIRELA